MRRIARVRLVGERSSAVRAHGRYAALFDALWRRAGVAVDAYWASTADPRIDVVDGFDGVWLVPGSPYRSERGALAAVRAARERDLPFLATCGGFSHTLLEYARSVCGLADLAHAENAPDARRRLVVPARRPLAGYERRIRLRPGSLAERVFGAPSATERHHSGYELDPAYAPLLEAGGLRLSGHDDDGVARVAELPDRRFYIAVAFQPELTAVPHPVVAAFAEAAAA